MEKIIKFRPKDTSYDILTDTSGSLDEGIFKRFNIRINGTSASDVAGITDFLRPSLEAGRDILYISASDPDSAKKAATDLMAAYKDRHIICVTLPSVSEEDSLRTLKMSGLRAAGATLDEVASYYMKHRHSSPVTFPASWYSQQIPKAISI